MKDRILEFFDAQLGRVLLVIALLLGGWAWYANRYEPLPKELTEAPPRAVYVELEPKAMSLASTETYYVAANPELYNKGGRFVFVPEVTVTQFVPVELDIPPISIKRPPQILPDPGPSLEGAHGLPRFGDEFAPVSSDDLPVKAKSGGTTGPKSIN